MPRRWPACCSSEPEVAPAGLGARDSLRLEAGLCLYGHEIDADTTPVEAGLGWTIAKRRRARRRLPRRRRDPAPAGRGQRSGAWSGSAPTAAPRRAKAPRSSDPAGQPVGMVTSGGFGPTVGGPVALGYVARRARRARHSPLQLLDPRQAACRPAWSPLPFVPHRYQR